MKDLLVFMYFYASLICLFYVLLIVSIVWCTLCFLAYSFILTSKSKRFNKCISANVFVLFFHYFVLMFWCNKVKIINWWRFGGGVLVVTFWFGGVLGGFRPLFIPDKWAKIGYLPMYSKLRENCELVWQWNQFQGRYKQFSLFWRDMLLRAWFTHTNIYLIWEAVSSSLFTPNRYGRILVQLRSARYWCNLERK